ncbi:MAG: plasmid pRiA4b ORF-3 family protein, partial [Mariprofundaceae bacterium]|nr:plasmid pRiA4b ORF-3 family protein [Mariprofundaceae bacterium]
ALHCAIQIAMGWTDAHLYAFRTKTRYIEIPDPDNMWDAGWSNRPKPEDSAKVHLREVVKPGEKTTYEYDFGDGWEHTILIEKAIKTDDISACKAECLKGKRACPPEDCGGPWGYQNLLEVLAMPVHKRNESEKEFAEWIGGDWDAEACNLSDINDALTGWKPNQTSYMYKGICG